MINTAVIGYGYAGRSFHTYLVGLAAGLNLYAIAARSPERRQAAAQAHPNVKLYETIDQVIADDDVNLVILATPHDTTRRTCDSGDGRRKAPRYGQGHVHERRRSRCDDRGKSAQQCHVERLSKPPLGLGLSDC